MKITSTFYKILFSASLLVCYLAVVSAQVTYQTINQTLIGPGQMGLDMTGDSYNEYTFDIIQLSVGSLAARVHAQGSTKILDNSTFGYPDALNAGDPVAGYFHSNVGVLGTFNDAGQFKGKGNRFLGVQLSVTGTNYGWIELSCSQNNDTLTLISYGFVELQEGNINAGETELTGTDITQGQLNDINIYPNPATNEVFIKGLSGAVFDYHIYSITGGQLIHGNATDRIDVSSLPGGVYIVRVFEDNKFITENLFISK
jgi:hypothetical protein